MSQSPSQFDVSSVNDSLQDETDYLNNVFSNFMRNYWRFTDSKHYFATNNKLYLQDHTITYSIAKAIKNYVLRIRTKI